MAQDPLRRVRLPEVRQALLRDVSVLAQSARRAEDEVAFGDAVEEVHHLLDPAHGCEPGDVLVSDGEVAVAQKLWHALAVARWPLDPDARDQDDVWAEARRLAGSLVAAAR
jgi:hypothetical protein